MDALHVYGVRFELWLQRVLAGHADYFLDITKVGDPDLLILYLFPFVCAINRNLFMRFVMTAALCDFMNNVFKWMLHGERPYWWVVEHGMAKEANELKQFKLTCESGPGSPSGHAMITSSVWFILTYAYVSHVAIQKSRHRYILSTMAWMCYLLLFTLVSISRLYIATHFPHQVLLGGVIGVIVGIVFIELPIQELRLKHTVILMATLIVFAGATYSVMLQLGVSPDWALSKALAHCANKEWVKRSATPLAALFRDAGAIIGLGLAVESPFFRYSADLLHRDGSEVATAVVSFICVQFCAFLLGGPAPEEHLYAFYIVIMLRNILICFVSVAFVPYAVMKIMNLKRFPTAADKPPDVIRREMLLKKKKGTANW